MGGVLAQTAQCVSDASSSRDHRSALHTCFVRGFYSSEISGGAGGVGRRFFFPFPFSEGVFCNLVIRLSSPNDAR